MQAVQKTQNVNYSSVTLTGLSYICHFLSSAATASGSVLVGEFTRLSNFSDFPSTISIFAFCTRRPLFSSFMPTVDVRTLFSVASPLFFKISAIVTTVAMAIPRAESSTSLCCCMYLLARLT
ncbi:hypothetical protein V8G54_028567 [Vigna mungo]|uniref:Uncharacterized protein n=1 Tax=Vigna mungo TaxID=3915 RepID=A0AAQ3RJH5_VIGMU